MKLQVYRNAELLAQAAARGFVDALESSEGPFHVALSGGKTPKRLFEILRTLPVEWSRVHVWFGDERYVAPDDAASNFRTAADALLNHVSIPSEQVHPMVPNLEEDPKALAAAYADKLNGTRLNLVWLGLGTDAHTASLFPGEPGVFESERQVIAAHAPVAPHQRISMTPVALNNADRVEFLIAGTDKATALKALRFGHQDFGGVPSQAIARVAQNVVLRVDEASLTG